MTYPSFNTGDILTASDMNAVGLWRVTPTSVAGTGVTLSGAAVNFTASATVSINGCFSSTYDSYFVICRSFGSVNGGFARWRLRVAGVDAQGADYYRYGFTTNSASAVLTAYNGAAETGWIPFLEYGTNAAESCTTHAFVHNPARSANRTVMSVNVNNSSGAARYTIDGMHAQAVAYDGFTIYANAGTMTGTVSVFGYRVP